MGAIGRGLIMGEQDVEEPVVTEPFAREKPRPPSARVYKRRCLAVLLLIAAVGGAVAPFLQEGSRIDRCSSVFFALLGVGTIFLWCLYDSVERSYHIKLSMRILIFALACVGVPLYLLRTRGWRGVASIGLMLLFCAAYMMSASLSYVIVEFCLRALGYT